MRICIFARAVLQQGQGRMQEQIALLSEGLAKNGISVSIITTSHPDGKDHEKSEQANYYYIPGSAPMRYSHKWAQNAIEKFQSLHSQNPFDLVHIYLESGWGFPLHELKKNSRVPVATSVYGTTYETLKSQLSRFALSLRGASFAELGLVAKSLSLLLSSLYNYFFVDSKYFSNIDMLIAPSTEQKKKIMEAFPFPERKIRLVYNGIDENIFSPIEKYIAVQKTEVLGTPVFLCAGNLARESGVHNAILAMNSLVKDYPTALLVVIGDGEYKKDLEELAKRVGAGHNVTFKGPVSLKSLIYYFNSCDIFLDPAISPDYASNYLLEAMSCARAVVASNLGTAREIIEDGLSGALVKPASVQDLVFGIENLLRDSSKLKKVSENARKKVLAEYSSKSMVSKTILAYKDAIKSAERR